MESTMLSSGIYLQSYNIKSEADLKKAGLKLDKNSRDLFKAIEGNNVFIDTPEEFIMASYFSPIQIQDISASAAIEAELPHAEDKKYIAGIKLGMMWYDRLVEYQACTVDVGTARDAQVGRYEGAIKYICDNLGVTRAQIVAAYNAENGIQALIAETVDREFNTISFSMSGGGKTFNTILVRNPDMSYTLKYERPSVANDDKEITAGSLELLLAAMGKSPELNFPACIADVKQKQTLIPAVAYANYAAEVDKVRARMGVTGKSPDALQLIKDMFTAFYLDPSDKTIWEIAKLEAHYLNYTNIDPAYTYCRRSIATTMIALSGGTLNKLTDRYFETYKIAGLVGKGLADPPYEYYYLMMLEGQPLP